MVPSDARSRLIGQTLIRRARVTSTNDVLRGLLAHGADPGTVVVATEQTAGRGRLGRPWASPPGGLWLSCLLREDDPTGAPLAQVLGVGAAEGLRAATGVDVRLDWPNDLVIAAPELRKVGGILIEATPPWAVVGVGVNVNVNPGELPLAVRGQASSLAAFAGRVFDLDSVLGAVLEGLDDVYAARRAGRVAEVLDRWRRLSVTLGRRVAVTTGEETAVGIAVDLAGDGALLVETEDGAVRSVVAGEVRALEGGT